MTRPSIKRALASFPKKRIVKGFSPKALYTVPIDSASAANIAAGIWALGGKLKECPPKAYVRLEIPRAVETARRFGPVRFVSMYVMFPTDGGEPGMRHRLDVGVA